MPSQALPRQLPQRGSQAVRFITKVLGAMRKFPAALLPLPLGEVASRSDDGEGAARLMGAAPHPALRATFPRRVKASAVAIQFPA